MKPTHRYDTKAYHDYYIHQAGKGYPVFAGRRYQRGHGLGSIFGGLFKAAMPLLKKGAKTLEREALKTGLNIAGDVVQGRHIIQAAKSRLKSTGENLLQKAMDTVGPQDPRTSEKRPDIIRPSSGTHRMTFRIRMALVHFNSSECTKSKLDLFEVQPTQTSVAYRYWEQKGLTSALTDQGPYEFAVSGAGDNYIDLANTYHTALDGGADVGPVNLWRCIPSLVMSVLA